jgi:hypothetical protein
MSIARKLKNPLDSLAEVVNEVVIFFNKKNIDECKVLLAEANKKYQKAMYWKSFIFTPEEDLTSFIDDLTHANIQIKMHDRFDEGEWSEYSLNIFIIKKIMKGLEEYKQVDEWTPLIIQKIRKSLLDAMKENIYREMREKIKNLKSSEKYILEEEKQLAADLVNSQIACSMKTHEIIQAISLSLNEDDADVIKLKKELQQLQENEENNQKKYVNKFNELHSLHVKIKEELQLYMKYTPKENIEETVSTTNIIYTLKVNDAEQICWQKEKVKHDKSKNLLSPTTSMDQASNQISESYNKSPVVPKKRRSIAAISNSIFKQVADSVLPEENKLKRSLGRSM